MHVYRHEHYTAGRVLIFSGCLTSAGIMLGYAVELSLKAALIATGFPKFPKRNNPLWGHEIVKLFDKCQQQGIFQCVQVSRDFLKYVEDWLNRRYPSQEQKLSERLSMDNLAQSFSLFHIDAYDDFLLQMDDALVAYTKDPWRVSVGVRSALHADTYPGAAFFHGNTAAILRVEAYLKALREALRDQRFNSAVYIEKLENWKQRLSKANGLPAVTAEPRPGISIDDHPAALFQYPSRNEVIKTYSNIH
jgi:hypothetical protein